MSGYAYDPPAAVQNGATAANGVLISDASGTPFRNILPSLKGGGMPNEATLRKLAYYLIVGGVVTFAVSKLAVIK